MVVPKVTPRFPNEVARLFPNSKRSGTDEIIYVEAYKKLGEYRNPQIPMTTIVASVFPSEMYRRMSTKIVTDRKNAVVFGILLFSILPAIQLANTNNAKKKHHITYHRCIRSFGFIQIFSKITVS